MTSDLTSAHYALYKSTYTYFTWDYSHDVFRTVFMDLNLYCIKGALALFVLVSGYVCYIKLYTQLSSPR